MSRTGVGYKLHVICSGNPMPDAFAITTLATCERRMAARMMKRVDGYGPGRAGLVRHSVQARPADQERRAQRHVQPGRNDRRNENGA